MLPLLAWRWPGQDGRPRGSRGYGLGGRLVNRARQGVAGLLVLLSVASVLPVEAHAVPRILAFGDSLMAGYGLAPEDAFPAQLAARLKADGVAVEMINGGVSGDTSAGGLARLDWALGDHPDYVLVEFGANDMLRGIDPKVTYTNLDRILARLEEAKIGVLLLGMRAPANWGRAYQQEFDAIYPKLAKKYDVPLYPFLLDGAALDPKYTQADGLHPNAAGVAVMVAGVAPYVERLLSRVGG
jgi:acyl-CoA thioesterase-1